MQTSRLCCCGGIKLCEKKFETRERLQVNSKSKDEALLSQRRLAENLKAAAQHRVTHGLLLKADEECGGDVARIKVHLHMKSRRRHMT